ncbi:hypothetical protein V2G26_000522 [Clonostachys chloroleuca]
MRTGNQNTSAYALIPNQGSEMNGEIEGGAAPGRSPAPSRVICTGPLIRTRTVRLSLATLPSPHALATRLLNLLGPASDRKGPPGELGQYGLATRSSTTDDSLALILAHHGFFLDSPVQLHKAASPDRRSRLETVPRPRKITPSRTYRRSQQTTRSGHLHLPLRPPWLPLAWPS